MLKRLLLYLFCAFHAFQSVHAQQYPMRNYRMTEGLSNSVVFRTYQDDKGFIWFCTNYGISRFDGSTFRNYTTKHGLGANIVMSMSGLNDSVLLVSTYGGGLNMLSESGIAQYPLASGSMPKKILYAAAHLGKIWLISTNITTLYCITNGALREVGIHEPQLGTTRFYKMIRHGNELLFTSSNGIYKTVENGSVVPFLKDIIHETITDLRIDNDGGIWAGLAGRILHIKGNRVVNEYKIDSKLPPGDMLVDHNNNIWIAGAEGGVFLVRNQEVKNITSMVGTGNAIVHDLFEDKEGNIWIATGGQGVYMLRSMHIINYPVEANKIRSYCKSISAINDSEVIVGSVGTVSKWTQGKLTPVPLKRLSPVAYVYFARRAGNNLYIGTPDGLIIKQLNGSGERMLTGPQKRPIGVLSFLPDGDSLWAGSFDAVYKIKNGDYILDSSDIAFGINRCNAICRNTSGALLFGTDSGVVSLKNNHRLHYNLPGSQATNVVRDIYQDNRGAIWYVTDSGLVYHTSKGMTVLSVQHGLTHNKCNAIAEDKYGILWVGTANGITSINAQTMQIKGLKGNHFENEILSVCCLNSLLFAGMGDGMSVLRTEQRTERFNPPIYIMSAKWAKGEIDMPLRLDLPYNERKLNIQFAALSFSYPESIQYRYRIAGLSHNWHITYNKEIDIQALPTGNFVFMVSARVNKEKWGPVAQLPIHVKAPLWQNKWLIALFFITVSWLIYFVTKKLIETREAKKRSRMALYNRIIYLKQQALSALINPHFIFNCMNSIQHYMHSHDHYMANMYLADFAQLIRMTLEHARSAFIPLYEEINRIKLYLSLEQLRFGEDLQYDIHIDPALKDYELHIPNMIIQPYVENAIWHGIMPNKGIGNISIRFLKHNAQEMEIQIIDNGIGINKSKETAKHNQEKSFGMKLTADRLHVLHQMLGQPFSVTITETSDLPGNVTGTQVKIILPLKPNKNHLAQVDNTLTILSGTSGS